MAIFRPGDRHRYHNILSKQKTKRAVTAVLSLTAMVDMFTVLVIFLLQNYDTQIFYTPDGVELPKAANVKELKPAFVITISKNEIFVDKTAVATFAEVQANEEWMVQPLFDSVKAVLDKAKADQELGIQNKLQSVVDTARGQEVADPDAWRKVTIQADRGVDFLTVKKVMFTVTEAGAGEINFAVMKQPNQVTQ